MEALTGLGWGDDDIHHYIHLTKYTLPATGIRNLELWKMYVRFVERVLEAQVPILVVWKNAAWLIGGILPCSEWLLILLFLGTTFWRNQGFSNLHTRRYRSAQSWWHMYTLRFRDLDARCGRGFSVCGERAWCRLPEVWPTCDEATKLLTMVSMFVTPQNNSLSADTTRESSDFGAVILSPFPGIKNGPFQNTTCGEVLWFV